jgi:hypothetical protein
MRVPCYIMLYVLLDDQLCFLVSSQLDDQLCFLVSSLRANLHQRIVRFDHVKTANVPVSLLICYFNGKQQCLQYVLSHNHMSIFYMICSVTG